MDSFTTLAMARSGPAGCVLHLTLNRPEVRNAMSLQMVQELRAALAAAEADGRTRVVVLRGAGGHFCAGADLKDMAAARARLAEHPDALAAAEHDGSTRVVVLRGAGGHFCAGADLRDMAAARARLADDPDALVDVNAAFGELCVAFAQSPLAVVAVLEGTLPGRS